jgi:hypothetical protein
MILNIQKILIAKLKKLIHILYHIIVKDYNIMKNKKLVMDFLLNFLIMNFFRDSPNKKFLKN